MPVLELRVASSTIREEERLVTVSRWRVVIQRSRVALDCILVFAFLEEIISFCAEGCGTGEQSAIGRVEFALFCDFALDFVELRFDVCVLKTMVHEAENKKTGRKKRNNNTVGSFARPALRTARASPIRLRPMSATALR